MHGKYALGGRGDSYYEYLLKLWLQTGKTNEVYKNRYLKAAHAILHNLISVTEEGLVFIDEIEATNRRTGKMDHLACFFPGVLALGWYHGLGRIVDGVAPVTLNLNGEEKGLLRTLQTNLHTFRKVSKVDYVSYCVFHEYQYIGFDHLDIAKLLTKTCVISYRDTATGLSPEIFRLLTGPIGSGQAETNIYGEKKHITMAISERDAFSLLRPETVESLYIMWMVTNDEQYRIWGWDIFQAFRKYARDPATGAYCGVNNVRNASPENARKDETESFFLAETLKYLYLLFEDPTLFPLDSLVINTEAHPFEIFTKN